MVAQTEGLGLPHRDCYPFMRQKGTDLSGRDVKRKQQGKTLLKQCNGGAIWGQSDKQQEIFLLCMSCYTVLESAVSSLGKLVGPFTTSK